MNDLIFNQFEGDELVLVCDSEFEDTYSVKNGSMYLIYSHDNSVALICNNCGEIIEIPVTNLVFKPLNWLERLIYRIFNN